MKRVTTIAGVRAAVADARRGGARIGLVPTMGALHAGHLSLVERCRELAGLVVVSIFVNPTQFAPGEDLAAYPRDLEGDEAALRDLGEAAPDLVFAPSVEEVYPGERVTTVTVRGLNAVLCGVSRPTHFDGVTTVVAKLLNIVQPDVAVFGRKDFQQVTILRRMVADLDVPVEVVGGAIVREPDGVAMSSRNRYLGDDDRTAARALSRGLRAAVEAGRAARDAGERPDAEVLHAAAARTLRAEPGVRTDYVEVLDPDTLAPPTDDTDRWLVAVAAHVGAARLIDNVVVGDRVDEDALLAATDDTP
jgi:pantoate--beta-alanine ligase